MNAKDREVAREAMDEWDRKHNWFIRLFSRKPSAYMRHLHQTSNNPDFQKALRESKPGKLLSER